MRRTPEQMIRYEHAIARDEFERLMGAVERGETPSWHDGHQLLRRMENLALRCRRYRTKKGLER